MKSNETFIVFPVDSAYTFPLVTHSLDFLTGKVDVEAAADLALSGRLDQDKDLQSVLFKVDKLLNVEILLNDDLKFKGAIPPGLFGIQHITFNLIRVIPKTATTVGMIYASTHPECFGGNSL